MISQRLAHELLYQLDHAGQQPRLAQALATIPLFITLCRDNSGRNEIMSYWKKLGDAGGDIPEVYQARLENYRHNRHDLHEELYILKALTDMYQHAGWSDAAIVHYQAMEALAEELGDGMAAALAEHGMGRIRHQQGRQNDALQHFDRARALYTKIGEPQGASVSTGHMGLVYSNLGEYERALEHLTYQLDTCTTLGYAVGESVAACNVGNVHYDRQAYDTALHFYQRALRSAKSADHRSSIAIATCNIGNIYRCLGDLERAIEYYDSAIQTSQEIGHRYGISLAIGNKGVAYRLLGEHEKALHCFNAEERLAVEMNSPFNLGFAYGNQARIYFILGQLEESLDRVQRAIDVHQSIGLRYGLGMWRSFRAEVLLSTLYLHPEPPPFMSRYISSDASDTPPLRAALARAARKEIEDYREIGHALGLASSLQESQVMSARLLAAEGRTDDALDSLRTLLTEPLLDIAYADIYYWLWKLGEKSVDEHRAASLRIYQTLHTQQPHNEFRKRMEELASAGEGG